MNTATNTNSIHWGVVFVLLTISEQEYVCAPPGGGGEGLADRRAVTNVGRIWVLQKDLSAFPNTDITHLLSSDSKFEL